MQSLNASRPHLGLRSTLSTDFSLPQLRTKSGERACSHNGPSAWNSKPEHIRVEPDIRVFRKLLKTHLFNLAFNVHWHSGFYTVWLLEYTYVQYVIGALQMHWMMMKAQNRALCWDWCLRLALRTLYLCIPETKTTTKKNQRLVLVTHDLSNFRKKPSRFFETPRSIARYPGVISSYARPRTVQSLMWQ